MGKLRIDGLPVPPSANAMYRMYRSRIYPTSKYKEWLEITVPLIVQEFESRGIRTPLMGRAQIHAIIYGGRGFRDSGDVGNLEKASTDALKPSHVDSAGRIQRLGAAVIFDDSVKYVNDNRQSYVDRADKKAHCSMSLIIRWLE